MGRVAALGFAFGLMGEVGVPGGGGSGRVNGAVTSNGWLLTVRSTDEPISRPIDHIQADPDPPGHLPPAHPCCRGLDSTLLSLPPSSLPPQLLTGVGPITQLHYETGLR